MACVALTLPSLAAARFSLWGDPVATFRLPAGDKLSRVLPRFLPDDSEEWEAKLARIIATTGDRETKPKRGQKQPSLVGFRSSEADRDRLRAIPVQCVEGVGGTIPDTNPLYALLSKENGRR